MGSKISVQEAISLYKQLGKTLRHTHDEELEFYHLALGIELHNLANRVRKEHKASSLKSWGITRLANP